MTVQDFDDGSYRVVGAVRKGRKYTMWYNRYHRMVEAYDPSGHPVPYCGKVWYDLMDIIIPE